MATINICDICKTRHNVNRKQYAYGTQPDGAGSSETTYEIFDLCCKHEVAALTKAIKASLQKKTVCSTIEFNRLIIAEIERLEKDYSEAKHNGL